MRTTIDINDATLAELRKRAGARARPFREVVEETLQLGLAVGTPPPKQVCVQSYPLGVKGAYRGLSMNQLFDQLEAEDQLSGGGR